MGVGRRLYWGAIVGVFLGCAGGEGVTASLGPGFSGPGDASGGTTEIELEGESTTTGPGDVDPSGPTLPDLGACGDDLDCVLAEGFCFEKQGVCTGGACEFAPRAAGAPCDDADACTDPDACDGIGGCVGETLDCSVEHGVGECIDGGCGAITCDEGWGDCNADAVDGCETPLDTMTDCGGCGSACGAGSNATASCNGGDCVQSCTAPFENCDDDWDNGCEIPTGIPNQCDVDGLNSTSGCWTAHCGSSNNPDARNFGSWYCFECTTCNVPSAGQCRWCSHDTGTWFPQEACACGTFEDTVCTP